MRGGVGNYSLYQSVDYVPRVTKRLDHIVYSQSFIGRCIAQSGGDEPCFPWGTEQISWGHMVALGCDHALVCQEVLIKSLATQVVARRPGRSARVVLPVGQWFVKDLDALQFGMVRALGRSDPVRILKEVCQHACSKLARSRRASPRYRAMLMSLFGPGVGREAGPFASPLGPRLFLPRPT